MIDGTRYLFVREVSDFGRIINEVVALAELSGSAQFGTRPLVSSGGGTPWRHAREHNVRRRAAT